MKSLMMLLCLVPALAKAGITSDFSKINSTTTLFTQLDEPVIPASSGTLSSVCLVVQTEGSVDPGEAGSVILQLYSDNAGIPGSAIGDSKTVAISSLVSIWDDPDQWYPNSSGTLPTVCFSPNLAISSASLYHVVISGDADYLSNRDSLGEYVDVGADSAFADDSTHQPVGVDFLYNDISTGLWASSSGGSTAGVISTEVTIQ